MNFLTQHLMGSGKRLLSNNTAITPNRDDAAPSRPPVLDTLCDRLGLPRGTDAERIVAAIDAAEAEAAEERRYRALYPQMTA